MEFDQGVTLSDLIGGVLQDLDARIADADSATLPVIRDELVASIDGYFARKLEALVEVVTVEADSHTETSKENERVLPSLLDRLEHSHTVHTHKYDESDCVRDALKLVEQKEPQDRTPADEVLITDIDTIAKFAGRAGYYQFIYTPEEIHTIAVTLRTLEKKNRPDFDGIEDDLIDVNSALLRGDPRKYGEEAVRIKGIIARAANSGPKRRGMTFETMVRVASTANTILSDTLDASEERREYIIPVQDPEKSTGVDLSAVYQFVVNYNAYQILLKRSAAAGSLNRAVFENNCTIIDDYMTQVADVLDGIPTDIVIEQGVKSSFSGRGSVRKHRPADYLRRLQSVMHERLANGATGQGNTKGYKVDSMAAYRLQRLIGHTVEAVNEKLITPPEETRIIPLDDLDLDLELDIELKLG